MIGKLLGLATISGTFAGMGLVQHFLSGITKIVILATVSAFMLCGLLGGSFVLAYLGLVYYGLAPIAAIIAVGTLAVLVTGTLVAITLQQMRQLRELPQPSLMRHNNGLLDIAGLADAFIDGFLNHRE